MSHDCVAQLARAAISKIARPGSTPGAVTVCRENLLRFLPAVGHRVYLVHEHNPEHADARDYHSRPGDNRGSVSGCAGGRAAQAGFAAEHAAARRATGDQDLLALNPFRGIPILTPAQFLAAMLSPGAPHESRHHTESGGL